MAAYKTRAIVLKRRNQGESDRVLTLFSPEHGRITAVAKGARKMKSKLAGGIELFSKSDFVISPGKTFEIISEATLVKNYLADHDDIRMIDFGHLAAELVSKLIPEKHPIPGVYETLEYSLANLGSLSTDMLELYLISRFTNILGIYPELSVCLDCGKKPTGVVIFSHVSGGIYCENCGRKGGGFEIGRNTVKLWRFLISDNGNNVSKLNIEDAQVAEALNLARTYISRMTANEYQSLHYSH